MAKGVPFLVSPASQAVYQQCVREGLIETLLEAAAQVITPGCGICQPKVVFLANGEACITSTTRNFRGRNGGMNAEIYLGGPATIAAAALTGEIVDLWEVRHGV